MSRALVLLLLLIWAVGARSAGEIASRSETAPTGVEESQDVGARSAGDKTSRSETAPTGADEESRDVGARSAGDENASPFDYESSEQISEDLSVSFPVDI